MRAYDITKLTAELKDSDNVLDVSLAVNLSISLIYI